MQNAQFFLTGNDNDTERPSRPYGNTIPTSQTGFQQSVYHHSILARLPTHQSGGPEMTAPTREEIDAKLAATEARIETKLTALESKFDLIATKIDYAIGQISSSQEVVQKTADRAENAALRAEEITHSTRWNMIFLALAVVASVIATLAFGAQMFGVATSLIQTVQSTQPSSTTP